MADLTGMMVGDYFLLECLAEEGPVATYRARPTMYGGYDVMLRIYQSEEADLETLPEPFATEVKKLWQCRHPHIQPLLEIGSSEGLIYTVTQSIEAETLEDYLMRQQEQYLPLSFVLQLMTQVCQGLNYAHQQGIVHGNIQPSSVLLKKDQDILLTHFDLEPLSLEQALSKETDRGNPAYRAPEQFLGKLLFASDIYALGVLLYRLLVNVLPYEDSNSDEMALKHRDEPIPSLRVLRPGLSEEVELVVRVALAKAPEARFPDPQLFLNAFENALGAPGSQTQVTTIVPLKRVLIRPQRALFPWATVALL